MKPVAAKILIVASTLLIVASACGVDGPIASAPSPFANTPEALGTLDAAGALTATKEARVADGFATRDAAATVRAFLTAAMLMTRTQRAEESMTAFAWQTRTPIPTRLPSDTLTAKAADGRAFLDRVCGGRTGVINRICTDYTSGDPHPAA